jgi:hypothetical protein
LLDPASRVSDSGIVWVLIQIQRFEITVLGDYGIKLTDFTIFHENPFITYGCDLL